MRHDATSPAIPDAGSVEVKPSGCPGSQPAAPRLCASATAALALLDQAVAFIDTIDDASFSHPSRLLPGGTIGKHFRHVVDHFAASLAPLRPGTEPAAVIEYDRRERNVPMETSRAGAIAEIRRVAEELARADEMSSAGVVTVRVMLAGDGTERDFPSTLGREIAFASHHAIHHHAMIQVIAGELGIRAPEGFGKAPSTISFERHCHSAQGG